MRKFFGLLVVAAMAALSVAGIASAGSNLANGTLVTGTNSGGIALGGVITCNSSTVKGTITNTTPGASLTISNAQTNATFTNCGSGNSVTSTGHWKLETQTNTGNGVFDGVVTNVTVDITAFGGLATCHYGGTLNAGNYNNNTELLTLGGSLTKGSGSSLCPTTAPVSGQYTVSPTLQLS